MTITKTTTETYKLRNADTGLYWADINIDEGEKSGRIQIASGFGSWQNYWGACGTCFKSFLLRLNMEYVADKLGEDRWFDQKRTIAGIKELAAMQPKDARKKIFEEITELEDYSKESEFISCLHGCRAVLNMYDGWPEIVHDVTPQFRQFWTKVWPVFTKHLKSEINTSGLKVCSKCNDNGRITVPGTTAWTLANCPDCASTSNHITP